MSYVCEVVNTATQACDQWAVYSPILPELTTEARNELMKWAVGVFISVLAIRKTIQVIR